MDKAQLIEQMASQAFQTEQGRKGLNAVNVKVIGEREDGDDGSIHATATALDAPLVHLAGAKEMSEDEKLEYADGLIDEVREDDKVEYEVEQ